MVGDHSKWCRATFDRLGDGNHWVMPRSGLIFQRRGGELVLVRKTTPQMDILPQYVEQLQALEFEEARAHFAVIGVVVREELEATH